MPSVSVIVPVFNAGEYLAECLDSVLAQTFTDFEVVCVDDGSTDDSAKVLEEFCARDSRVRMIRQENQGVVAARNNAIAVAVGEVLYLLDGDDAIDRTALEKLYKAFKAGKGDVVTSRVLAFGAENREIELSTPGKRNMALANRLVNAAMFRKSLWEAAGGFDSAFNDGLEDYDFYSNLLYRQHCRFYRVQELLFFYRIKKGAESRNHKCTEQFLEVLHKRLDDKYPERARWRRIDKVLCFFFHIRRLPTKITVKLFRIPLLKIKPTGRYYLFGFLPVFRMSNKEG